MPIYADGVKIAKLFVDGVSQQTAYVDGVLVFTAFEGLWDGVDATTSGIGFETDTNQATLRATAGSAVGSNVTVNTKGEWSGDSQAYQGGNFLGIRIVGDATGLRIGMQLESQNSSLSSYVVLDPSSGFVAGTYWSGYITGNNGPQRVALIASGFTLGFRLQNDSTDITSAVATIR